MTKNLKDLIGNSNYVILENGKIISSGGVNDLNFSRDTLIIHFISRDTDVTYNILSDSKLFLEEVYYKVNSDVTINVNINAQDGCYLEYYSLRKNEKSENIVINVNTKLGKDSYIDNKNITLLSSKALVNQKYEFLDKGGILSTLDIVLNTSGDVQIFNLDTLHNFSETKSKMHNYCISKNNSVIHMNTNGEIKKDAGDVSLNQKTKGLILDTKSQISANPWLLIDDFNCMASHGASIGAIDEEELYYLMSRGLTKEEAEKLIVEGFVRPFTNSLIDENLKDYCLDLIKKYL